jgi:hypothetical protein
MSGVSPQVARVIEEPPAYEGALDNGDGTVTSWADYKTANQVQPFTPEELAEARRELGL